MPRWRRRNLLPGFLILLAGVAGAADQSDADKQAELDRRCEEARAVKLAPIRADIYKDCVEKKQGDEAYCRRSADGYNGNRKNGAPRFYELPECQAAFEFRNSSRR
jgi:hypothetical protein